MGALFSPSRAFRAAAAGFVGGVALHALDESHWGAAIMAAAAACVLLAARVVARSAALAILCASLFLFASFRYDVALRSGEQGPSRVLEGARASFRWAAGTVFPEPEASLVVGLVSGDRSGIPRDIVGLFRDAGTSHILAVSGYNVAQVIGLGAVALSAAGLRKRRGAALLGALVAGFVVFTGAEASVLRAGIMGAAGVLASGIGRRYDGTNALLLAAALMLAAEPKLLRHDLGFQLSFAALLGLRHLSPAVARLLIFVPKKIRGMTSETLGATFATLPITLAVFGTLPVATLAANLAVLPLVPLAMFGGATAVAAGWFAPALGIVLAAPVIFLVRIILVIHRVVVDVLPPMDISRHRFVAAAAAAVIVAGLLLNETRAVKKERHA